MNIEKVSIDKVSVNPDNPRVIKDDKFQKLVQSIREFPQMLELRPIVVDADMVVLGGNMRLRACRDAGMKVVPIVRAAELTEEQKREFIIKDNVPSGEWNWEMLANEWDIEELAKWGLEVPEIRETEKLSELEFADVYYEPREVPDIDLAECVDRKKFEAKVRVIEESELTEEQKAVMMMFAYRFLKIDFEMVANYFYFNAGEQEKEVMKRLRLVLCDDGVNGFIEDDLLRIHKAVDGWEELND